ncbi:Putative aldehyde ferredoxin oxidoreductase [Candidatus Sulfobium mesophilum]|uniref:Aldehyde ferredoxin oxidoreductase n=1 Tax=Candidatus Sulfobium mesophilum TaxID=2016548 RepID=A0A2U3QJU8_9BACT|nr:Putative aldehyde ferredoxin oxidoreductase [Candidatus Sulfobium mesophilum]
MIREHFRVLLVDLSTGRSTISDVEGRNTVAGGSGLAAMLFEKYCIIDKPWNEPEQPLILTIGPLTGYFPLMSKTVCAFKSPYHDQYAESHGGGRSALSLRFADYDALVITGRAKTPSALVVGSRRIEIKDVHYLWGTDLQVAGKVLRQMFPGGGHRTILRIGPAGERLSPMACITADTYRHFGRLGGGAVMGSKNLKAIMIHGDSTFMLPESKDYAKVFDKVYKDMTDTDMMSKYHNLGTPGNVRVMNDLKALPIRNLQATTDPETEGITGERFAEVALLRNAACAGCPVGCIHIGFVRERFREENRYVYRQISYDHELIFAVGSMLGVMNCFEVLKLIDVAEKMGLDVMSPGVALAWATEALAKGIITEKETLVPLAFGNSASYQTAIQHLAYGTNEFYQILSQGTARAAERYGGGDFACVLGQEMAGYATGETFFVSQALGLRHSHLDSGGYSYDQKPKGKTVEDAVKFLINDEKGRVFLTSMVSCLFARGVYTDEVLGNCLRSVGYGTLADSMDSVAGEIQKLRWKMRVRTGYLPESVSIPKRFTEITTWKGAIDAAFMANLKNEYAKKILEIAG